MDVKMCNKFLEEMKSYEKLNKGFVIDVLNICVSGSRFIDHLKDFLNKGGWRGYYEGIIFSHEMDEDDDEYFGENKIMFYEGDDDDGFDIVTLPEFYRYLDVTCKFYIKYHKNEEVEVMSLLNDIKKYIVIVFKIS